MGERWTISFCPFLHFDNARTHSYEHNVSIVSWNVKSVLDFLEIDPSHKFSLDQITLLEGFRRLFPNYWDTLSQRVLEGRLEVVGGTYVMPDLILPDGESIIRQFEYGMQSLRKELGVTTKTGWAIDSAGHCSQMPQILRQCGIDSYYFTKGMPYNASTEFVWQGPDGSKVNAIWLKRGFNQAAWLSEDTREAFSNLMQLIDDAGSSSSSHNLFIPIGGELVPPPMHLSDIVGKWNEVFPDSKADIGNARDFSEKLKTVQSDLPLITGPLESGRFRGISSGGLTSRSRLKILNRHLENLLYLVELYLSLGGDFSHTQDLDNIWKMLLFNQDHNIIRGTISDDPYRLAIRRYNQAIEKAEELLENAVSKVSATIPTDSSGPSFVVFNPLPWVRSDIVRITVDRAMIGSESFIVIDDKDTSVPYQILAASPDTNAFEIVLIAEDVPSLGYRVFSLQASEKMPEFDTGLRSGKNWVESTDLILEFDSFSGALSRLYDKSLQAEFIDSPGSHITLETDVGDLYRFDPSQLSDQDSLIDSRRISGDLKVVETGPVRVVFEISSVLSKSNIASRVTVYSSIKRVDVECDIDYHETNKRMRFLLPIPIYSNHVSTGSQFMVEEKHVMHSELSSFEDHGHGIFSALDWVDCRSPEYGLGVSAIGIHEFQYEDGEFGLTFLRSPTQLSHGRDDEVMEAKTAREHGEHSFRISLLPHKSDWKSGMVHRRSDEHRLPLIAFPLDANFIPSNDNVLPALVIEGAELELSCFRPSEKDSEYIVRLYEIKGCSGTSTLKFRRVVDSAILVDFIGNEIGELMVSSDSVSLPVDPHSIITMKIKMH
ncbi:MAG: alpha-mannosidase [Candidatus Thorarchaeota archaeon]